MSSYLKLIIYSSQPIKRLKKVILFEAFFTRFAHHVNGEYYDN